MTPSGDTAPALRGGAPGTAPALRGGASRTGTLAAGALLAITGGVLCFAATPLWWFGGALLSSALVLFVREFAAPVRTLIQERTLVPASAIAEISSLAVVTAFATVMMGDIVGGQRPVSRDHTVHYAKAWLLHSHLLPTGRLFGWTNQWFAGYPANYLYPPGADLWVNAVHALFFGAHSFSQSYAIAFWLFHVFSGIAVYRLGKLVGGRAVGLLAAILCLSDLASFRMGGWQYTVEYGVWPQALSLDFGLMALCSLPALVETRKLAPLGAFGIWTGLAIITHPIYLIFLGLTALTAALAAGLADGVRAATAVLRLLIACVLSLLVGALWLLPFMTSRSETNSMGVWWDTTFEMAKGLIDLKLFPGTLGYVFAFGIVGISVMLKARRFAPLFVALSALAIPIISNSTFIDELHLAALSAAFSKIQYIRLSTMVKPFWFVLSAYVALAVFTHARDLVLGGEREPSPLRDSAARAAALAGVVGLLTIPVLVPTAQAFWTRNVRKSIMTEAERPLLADRLGLEQWLTRQLPRDGFYRVGVFTGDNHDLMDLASLIDRPLFKRGFTPASNFIYQMHDRDPAILEAINLRFAISKLFLPDQDFEQLASFGRYSVYRFKHWQPNPFQVIDGDGDVRLTRFSDEEVTLVAAPGAHGKLRLNISYFSRWHAYRDGKPTPIALTYLRESPDDTGFITVKLEPGNYRFVFERTLADRLAIPIGTFGILLCAALILADRRRKPSLWSQRALSALSERLDALSGQAWRSRRLLLLCAAASVVLAVLVELAMRVPPLDLQDLGALKVERVRFDFLERLANARANIQYGETRRNCIRQQDRLVCRDKSGNLDLDRYVASSPATLKDYILVRCIRARPVSDGVLNITYTDVPTGSAIVGYYGIERAGRLMSKRRPVQMKIEVNGKPGYDGQTQTDNEMHWFKVPMQGAPGSSASVTFSVRADNISRRYFCFNAQVVDLK